MLLTERRGVLQHEPLAAATAAQSLLVFSTEQLDACRDFYAHLGSSSVTSAGGGSRSGPCSPGPGMTTRGYSATTLIRTSAHSP